MDANMSFARIIPRTWSGWLGILQAVPTLVAFVQIVRCSGPAYVWVYLGLAVPLLRLVVSARDRHFLLSALRGEWTNIETFVATRGPLPWRATALLIVLPAGVFFLTNPRPLMTGDSKPIALIASGLVRNGTTELSSYTPLYAPLYHVPWAPDMPYFCLRTASGLYSSYPSGMCVFAVPPAALARLFAADLTDGGVLDRLEKSVASWLAAACLGLFFLLALHLTDARTAGLMTVLLAIGSGLCSTLAQALWQHGGVIFWMLTALLIEFRTWKRPRPSGVLLQGVALAMMFACRLASAILIASFGLWLLVRAPRRAILVGVAAALAYVPWACYYQAIYGTIFGPSIHQMPMFTENWRHTLIPLLFSPDHGLLVYQPWILLVLALAVPSVRRLRTSPTAEVPAAWPWFCVMAIVAYVALVSSWYCWWGGHCWGSRLVVETVPFFALLCLPAIAALRRLAWGRRLLLATMLAAAFVQLPGEYLKVDFRDTQPALIGSLPEPPGSWMHWPFLTPLVGSLHSYR
jgi:hypothetical protein